MSVANKLKEQDWIVIQTRFESGDVMRDIANDFDIALGTVQQRAKKNGWVRNKIVTQITEIKEQFKNISQNVSHDQLILVNDQLKKDFDDIAQITKTITNLQKGALNLHGQILKDTIKRIGTEELSGAEASRILQSQGLNVKDIANMTGISKERPQTAVQVNNSTSERVQIIVDGIE